MTIFDSRRCELGEGPLWHPERQQLFWFDITGDRMLSREGDAALEWGFGERVSAAGWIDAEQLFVASETGFWRFEIATGARERVGGFPEAAPHLRTNDGRADPWGGFWISTMGKKTEAEAGGIWRYYRGELRLLVPRVTIPNAICFDAGRERAFFADTDLCQVWTQRLDPADGWPVGEPELFLDLSDGQVWPDGAVVDAEGRFWNAQWGFSRVACYDPSGAFLSEVRIEASQASCPAFGGPDLSTLFVTSALQGMDEAARRGEPAGGMTFTVETDARGLPEPAVILG